MTTTQRDPLTAEQYVERAITDRYSQLVDGDVVTDMPTEGHRVVVTRILRALDDWTAAGYRRGAALPSINLVMDERNVFGPDISYLRGDRVLPEGVNHMDGPADLVVEVRSLSTWRYNVGPKMRTYERFGLPELWLVDSPVGSVLVFRRSDPEVADFDVALEVTREESLTSPLLRGFELSVNDIFAPLRSRD